ncbi:GntR family transcriptional regulator [Szabonella alba]|uniref:GntR family transcriptional regulator n=1 Tax=Szabonella alba TaxID=2804194 RepID=A0A8K0VB49_9RHOB|nr:GntR family transcriptional regulator [Szabonella alba]MBL4918446.1 GntR family transcriptional regulator [Szabonella alba]
MAETAPQTGSPGHQPPSALPGLAGLMLTLDRHSSVCDQVHAVLRKAIVEVRLKPDELISENSICKQFSVSRTPVRAAIQRLAEEGLVDVSPQRGSFVAPLRLEALQDCQFVRRSLEVALLRETLTRWTPGMSAEMRSQIAGQERLVAADDPEGFLEEDDRFHRTLAGYSGREGVWAAIRAAKIPLMRFHRYWAHRSRLADVLREHRAIIDALDAGDPAASETALASHLDMVFVIFGRMTEEERARLPFEVPAGISP